MRPDDSAWPTWATEAVVLADADPDWQVLGAIERDALGALLAPWLVGRVEHVGSTAIPGLPAKPIIDLQAPVRELPDADSIAAALVSHGWQDVDPALDQRPWRRFFVKVSDGRRCAHLHVMRSDSARWDEQLAFRDALLTDASLVAEYAALKRTLVGAHPNDREAYTAGKTQFIGAVIAAKQ